MAYASGASAPIGTITSHEDVYLDGAPNLWFGGVKLWAPDDDGFYWGISGSTASPAYKIGCYSDFVFRDNREENDVRCDSLGVIAQITSRNYVEVSFTLQSFFPLSILTLLMRTGTVTDNAAENTSKFGIGDVTNPNTYYPAFFSRIYDPDAGDYFSVTLHRVQFINAWEISAPFGNTWNMSVVMRAFADDSVPAAQKFGTTVRWDPSVL